MPHARPARRRAEEVQDRGHRLRPRRAPAPAEKPGISNLIEIMSVATGDSIAAVEARYDGQGYGPFKEDVAEAVVELLAPIQAPLRGAARGPGRAPRGCSRSAPTKAREAASAPTLAAMFERMGFVPALHGRFADAEARTGRSPGSRRERLDLGRLRARATLRARGRRAPRPAYAAAVEAPHRVADRRAHPLHLVLAALVEHELEPPGPEAACAVRARCGRRRARRPPRAGAAPRRRGRPRRRPRRPSRRRSADARAGARAGRRS